MVRLQVKVVGLRSLIQRLSDAPAMTMSELLRALKQAAYTVEAEAKTLVPRRMANLQRSLHSEVQSLGSDARAVVGTKVEYGPYVEFGTGIYHEPQARQPWEVKPIHAKALAIPAPAGFGGQTSKQIVGTDGGGKTLYRTAKGGSTSKESRAQDVIFRRKVIIKGMKARPYLIPGYKNRREKIEQIFRAALARVNANLAKIDETVATEE